MRQTVCALFLLAALCIAGSQPPRVYKVEARQRPKTELVDVYYAVSDPDNRVVFIMLYLSDDNGKSWAASVKSLAGDTGFVTLGERKHIVWNAGRDFPNQYNLGFRVKIDVNDKKCPSRGDEGMAFIPEGEYTVGGQKVRTADFCIDKWEFPNIRDNMPQVGVNFVQAVDSCKSLGKQLCSETQWEIACAGPLANAFPYGREYKKDKCNSEGDSLYPIGVNRFCASIYGVFDLSGNAFEWVADWYQEGKKGVVPGNAEAEGLLKRVTRGGNYYLGGDYTRCTSRQWEIPEYATDHLGFRCCLSFEVR